MSASTVRARSLNCVIKAASIILTEIMHLLYQEKFFSAPCNSVSERGYFAGVSAALLRYCSGLMLRFSCLRALPVNVRSRSGQFRHALSAPTPLVARLRSSPSGSRARHRLIAAHYCVAARYAPLRALSPCPACASPRRTRTAVRLIAALPPQGYAALIAHAAPRRELALSSPAHIPASRHIVQPFSVAGLTLCGGDTPLVK